MSAHDHDMELDAHHEQTNHREQAENEKRYSEDSSIQLHVPAEADVLEAVGVSIGAAGRSCDVHDVCDFSLQLTDSVIFRAAETFIDGKQEKCVKVYRFNNGIQGCHIGFLPRYLRNFWPMYHDKKAQVFQDMRISDNTHTRRRSSRMGGIVRVFIEKQSSTEGN